MAITDLDGRFQEANPAFCRITRRSLEQLRQESILSLTHPGDQTANAGALAKLVTGEIPSFVVEKRYALPDGTLAWVRNSVSALRDEAGVAQELIAVCEDVTRRWEAEQVRRQELRRTKQELQHLTALLLSREDEQRRVLAHRLHEDAAQQLAALQIEVTLLFRHPSLDHADLSAPCHRLQTITERLTQELRELSYALYPPTLELLGLDVALRQLVAAFATRWPQEVTYGSRQVPSSLSVPLALALYRSAEDALQQIATFDPGSTVQVLLEGRPEAVTLRVRAAGPSLVQPPTEPDAGSGLSLLRERIRKLGGRVTVRTPAGGGMHLSIRVPFVR